MLEVASPVAALKVAAYWIAFYVVPKATVRQARTFS